jgi:hypothetical protein
VAPCEERHDCETNVDVNVPNPTVRLPTPDVPVAVCMARDAETAVYPNGATFTRQQQKWIKPANSSACLHKISPGVSSPTKVELELISPQRPHVQSVAAARGRNRHALRAHSASAERGDMLPGAPDGRSNFNKLLFRTVIETATANQLAA